MSRRLLTAIPIVIEGASPSANATITQPPLRYHGWRRLSQLLSFALVILVPAFGLLRIDPRAGGLVILDRQVWFSDFFLIAGLWLLVISALVMLYSVAGTVFCGWVCPQNILSEWANFVTRYFLGRRARVNMDGSAPLVASTKRKVINWVGLGLMLLAAALVFALVPLFFFYPPATVWSFVTWRLDRNLAGSLHWIYFVFVLIILLDVAFIRHFWCRFACVYRVWQHSFRTRETLHVHYDASRASECLTCNYCVSACFLDIDPRQTDVYDSCINCGECVDACNRIHSKTSLPGLLTMTVGERDNSARARSKFRDNTTSLLARSRWVLLLAAAGLAMFVWGLWQWQPMHLVVYRAEVQHQAFNLDYRIALTSKIYRPRRVTLSIEGLKPSQYHLNTSTLDLPPAGRASAVLSLSASLPKGVHALRVVAASADGWRQTFVLDHYSE